MGFFSILKDANSPASFEILQCHVNLWCLAGIFGRRRFTWDVGLLIRATNASVQTLRIALPSGTDKEAFGDLFQQLRHQETAELIFGKPVKITESSIDWGYGPIPIYSLELHEVGLDEKRSTAEFSIWTLKLSKPIPVGEQAYFRCRFEVTNIGRCWMWKHYLLTRYGALIDLRFSDVREAWDVKDGQSLQTHMVAIKKLNFFVVLPSIFAAVASSPPIYYTRILEGHAWQEYLRRKTRLFGKEKLAIYQWRNDKDVPVSAETPFRVYLDLSNSVRLISLANMAVAILVWILVTATGSYLSHRGQVVLPSLRRFILAQTRSHISGVTLTVLVLAASRFLKRLRQVRDVFLKVQTAISRLERKIFYRER